MEVPVQIPETLLVYPCDVVGPGTTVDSLARGYATNTACVGKYKDTLGGVIKYNDKIKNINKEQRDK